MCILFQVKQGVYARGFALHMDKSITFVSTYIKESSVFFFLLGMKLEFYEY